ncbi:hypothetical protein [Aureimonas sp. AU12]|uniref:hypothetical protein n=1 Tax=Aureimonas sp. AU12 TaxID=1638161 RepID=UPI0012E363BE|nr:hypothetical protein [Aureimonas sp. AU12]
MTETRAPSDPAAEDWGPAGSEAGTMLVELLVALALLSLTALFIAQGIVTVRDMAPAGRRIDAAAEAAPVRDHLQRTLGEALATLPGGGAASFRGTSSAMEFLAPRDSVLEVGGVGRVVLALEETHDGFALVERRQIERSPDDTVRTDRDDPTVLLRAIASARFSYAAPVRGEEPQWREDWNEATAWPALVRIEVTFRDAARRFRPLLVHPATTGRSVDLSPQNKGLLTDPAAKEGQPRATLTP